MHLSYSYSERSDMAPAPVCEPTPSGTPELPVGATRAGDGYRGRPAQSARYGVEPTPSGSVDGGDAQLILEMRHQEYVARRALDALFESGEAQILSL